MSAKRRDKKNRILRSGESQTQDGRYKYTFYEGGKQRAFYSWKLEPTDRLPAGKRDCVALRDQIADYKRQHDRGVAFRGDDYTVYELTRRYVDLLIWENDLWYTLHVVTKGSPAKEGRR